MRRPCVCLAASLLALAGCGDDEAAVSEEAEAIELLDATEPPDLGSEPAAHQAQTGLWRYDDGGVTENTCGDWAVSDGELSFWVSYADASRFVVVQGEPFGDFACFVAGTRFECPARLGGSTPVEGTDATLTYTVRIEGELTSPTSMAGEQRVDVECAGASCALAPVALGISFPCGWVTPFAAAAR